MVIKYTFSSSKNRTTLVLYMYWRLASEKYDNTVQLYTGIYYLFWPRPYRGLYIGKYPPLGGGGISADVFWGKKYEKPKRKRGKM